jgi:hypothetical protein
LRKTDSRLEISERFIKRVLKRKRNSPEFVDLKYLADEVQVIAGLLDDYLTVIKQGFGE